MGLPEFGVFQVEFIDQGDQIVERWSMNHVIHRIGKPAIITYDKETKKELEHKYFQDFAIHRDDGPAVITFDTETGIAVLEEYYQNNQLHRDDGPARIVRWSNGEIAEEAYFKYDERIEPPSAAPELGSP